MTMDEKNTAKLALSPEEARKQLGIGRGLMYELLRQNKFPQVRAGRRILIPVDGLKRWLENGGSDFNDVKHSEDSHEK